MVDQSDSQAAMFFREAAQRDSPQGQYLLGKMIEDGKIPSEQPFIQLYQEAANNPEEPSANACYALGRIKAEAALYSEAASLLSKAVGLSSTEAETHLGRLFLSGLVPGVAPEDAHRRAFRLLTSAATKGDTVAQTNLGMMRLKGVGCDESTEEARIWFSRAATKQDSEALCYLGYIEYRDGLSTKNEAKLNKANAYFRHALAIGDNTEAEYYLGNMLENGWGGAKDLVIAARLYEKAVNTDPSNHKAKFKLGRLYLEGRGVEEVDRERGIQLIMASAELGNSDASVYLGDLYLTSTKVERSPATAMVYYQQAAKQGNAEAQQHIASLLKAYPHLFSSAFRDPGFYQDRARVGGLVQANLA